MIRDSGFDFGIGVFETFLIKEGIPQNSEAHFRRLQRGMTYFGIHHTVGQKKLGAYIQSIGLQEGIVKLAVSQKNVLFSHRLIPYTPEHYRNGFSLMTSQILRNDTSPFTYYKTLNYGDNHLAKQQANQASFDEAMFLNSKQEICEGSMTNIFFIKGKNIYTPDVQSGLLEGTFRKRLLQLFPIKVRIIHVREIHEFDACFVTNAILGIMPVKQIDDIVFKDFSFIYELSRQLEDLTNP